MDNPNNIDQEFAGALHREAHARTEHLQLPEPTSLEPDAPATRFQEMVNKHGPGPTRRALAAWQARKNGDSIVQVACDLDLPIEEAKDLIHEVYEAISKDLKDNIELNRQLDLERLDDVIGAHLPKAKNGKVKSAAVVLRCLERRSKLYGLEPLPAPTQHHHTNVLCWIQAQMPSINKLVDSLPTELPPPAPGE